MGYDEVIPHLGEFGRYQRRIYFLLCLPAISCAFHKLSAVFLQAKPDYRCELPFEYRHNATYALPQDVMNNSFPMDSKTHRFSTCTYYDDSHNIKHCTSFVYDHSKYESSTVIEWNMVCERAYLKATTDSLFMFGVMIGSIGFGELSDRYGRKPIFFASLVLQVIFGLLAAVSPEFWTYTLTRLVVGATTSGVFLVAYVIALEMVGPSKRLFAGVVCQMFFSIGYMLTAAFAYYIREWRHLQIALTLPGLVFFCYWWFIPESTRWLILKKRFVDARNTVKKAAKVNHVEISDDMIDSLIQTDSNSIPDTKKATLFDIFRYPNLRKRSLLVFFDWFANSITYYGLSWNTSNLGGNDFLNFVISGAVEIPAYTFLLLTLNRWGRKSILCGCMLTAGVSLLLTMAVYDKPSLVVTLAMIGKLAITASYGTIYIFSTEQFPTVIRNVGLGACSTSARIGSVLAPIINLTSEVWQPLPLIIFGGLSLCGGLLSLLLPETMNKQLPESIADGEQFGRKEKKEEPPMKEMEALNGKHTNEEIVKFIEANENSKTQNGTALLEDVDKNT